MNSLMQTLPILAAPLAACVVIALLHGYAGLHVLRRGVIFVDIALAQMAALGTVVGTVMQHEHHAEHETPAVTAPSPATMDELEQAITDSGANRSSPTAEADLDEHGEASWFVQCCTLSFAIGGAVLLAFGRVRGENVPHEAVIGIVYVVAAAVTMIILSQAPHGHEQMEAMLVGKLLYVSWDQVLTMAALYAGLGVVHWIFRRPLLEISASPSAAEARGTNVRLWDCLFYGMFALMVTRSVEIGGVLVVFCYLIIPATCAALFSRRLPVQLVVTWVLALVVSLVGLGASAAWNWPTGSAVVATGGAVLAVCMMISGLRKVPA